MSSGKVVGWLAALTMLLAPLPAAVFVGRSVWWHLFHEWHVDLAWLGVASAVLTGAMIELVGLLSAHVALACARWNGKGHVKKEKGAWERAPVEAAAACFAVYVLAALALAVVLEAVPTWAAWSPACVVLMAAAAYVSVGLYEQHRDRLAYYGLTWDWEQTEQHDSEPKPEPKPRFASKADHIRWIVDTEPGIEQKRIVERTGYSPSYVSEVVNGRNGR